MQNTTFVVFFVLMEFITPEQLKRGDIVLPTELFKGRPEGYREALVAKLGEMGISPLEIARPSKHPQTLLEYSHEEDGPLGLVNVNELRTFLDANDFQPIVFGMVEHLIARLHYSAIKNTPAIFHGHGVNKPILYIHATGEPYSDRFISYQPEDRRHIDINMGSLEAHARRIQEQGIQHYHGFGPVTRDALFAFVNHSIAEASQR